MAALALGVRAAAPATMVARRRRRASPPCWPPPSDTRLGGFRLPFHSRQVNERWLDQFRPWVYGAGFGWQIGAGLVTYIKTAALYLMIVLAALTASPATALAIGASSAWYAGWPSCSAGASPAPPPWPSSTGASPRAGPVVLGVVVACELAVAWSSPPCSRPGSPWRSLLLGAAAATAGPARAGRTPARGPDLT